MSVGCGARHQSHLALAMSACKHAIAGPPPHKTRKARTRRPSRPTEDQKMNYATNIISSHTISSKHYTDRKTSNMYDHSFPNQSTYHSYIIYL